MTTRSDDRQAAVDHYENFPVASWLCPPRLRPPITAIYWFARTADDLADEGSAPAAQRLADLDRYRADLAACFAGRDGSGRWPRVFGPLRRAVAAFDLPRPPLEALLDAFTQDVHMTRDAAVYADRADLLAYCSRSANPVGRLLLHLYGVQDRTALAQSDAVCSALQLINFWQDLGVDVPRGRYYLPAADARRHGIDPRRPQHPAAPALVQELCAWARALMLEGAPLARRIPGRAGWELRLVVQGGLRILDRIAALRFDTLHARPKLAALDAPRLLWRAARM
ncbi:MAG TPA: squalene synthase HpnC [Ramlibacter sp.]|nr:squalene synthase HpnC [Ramlibacter sp.]